MIIFLCILLGISLFFNFIFFKGLLRYHKTIEEIELYLNEISFLNGDAVDDNIVLNKYEHAILISSMTAITTQEGYMVWDVSQYEKNHIVGLTTFAPLNTIQKGLQNAMEINPELFEGMSEEDMRQFKQDLSKKLQGDPTIAYDVDVYQMKDGTWLWR